MLDDTMGPAVVIATDGVIYPSTIDMTISFLAPARPGRLTGEAKVVQLGKTIAFLEGQLFDGTGKLLARATASARLMTAEKVVS